jgi:hypothetical protein
MRPQSDLAAALVMVLVLALLTLALWMLIGTAALTHATVL